MRFYLISFIVAFTACLTALTIELIHEHREDARAAKALSLETSKFNLR